MFKPKELRRLILQAAFNGSSVHIACAFSIVEIVSTLYSHFLKYDPKNHNSPDRDYLALSKGHGVMALYAAFKELGWVKPAELDNYFKNGTRLKGLGEKDVAGLEVTGGSLGHGLPVATGIAYGIKRKKRPQKVYTIVGDGEMNEGSIWESLLFASHQKLANLTIIVDQNDLQAMGKTKDILNLGSLEEKFKAFGFVASTCDGHSLPELKKSLTSLQNDPSDAPRALVARTTKGKGVSFMEDENVWHYTRLTPETLKSAMAELVDHA